MHRPYGYNPLESRVFMVSCAASSRHGSFYKQDFYKSIRGSLHRFLQSGTSAMLEMAVFQTSKDCECLSSHKTIDKSSVRMESHCWTSQQWHPTLKWTLFWTLAIALGLPWDEASWTRSCQHNAACSIMLLLTNQHPVGKSQDGSRAALSPLLTARNNACAQHIMKSFGRGLGPLGVGPISRHIESVVRAIRPDLKTDISPCAEQLPRKVSPSVFSRLCGVGGGFLQERAPRFFSSLLTLLALLQPVG
jgi:hypothetical protein